MAPAPTASAVTIDPWAEAFAESSRLLLSEATRAPAIAEDTRYPVTLNTQVRYFLDRFTGSRREVVSLWVSRSGRYLGMIREIFRHKGLPEDLAFTAMIESGFNPLAVSRVGAKGLWQFMAGTARRYGLRVDGWIDERLDPEKSTFAAAAYLRDLYGLFGSWPLAQAAYNAGEMTVARAIRSTGSNDFWALARTRHLAEETKEFVPQIHAATMIGRNPDRYGFDVAEQDPPATELVRVPGATDLRRLAAGAHIPAETLRSLNPVLVRGVTPPGTPYELKIPAGTRSVVLAALAAPPVTVARAAGKGPVTKTRIARARTHARTHVARAPSRTTVASARAGGKAVRAEGSSQIHVVRPRDTVASIARKYGVSVGDLVRWNSLEREHRIHPGDRLRVADIRPSVEHDGHGGAR